MKTNRSRVAVLAALVAPWAVAPAQQRVSFVTTLGKDTLSFEQFDRTQDSVVGDWVTTYGGIMVHHYAIHLRPDGSVDRYQLTMHGAYDLVMAHARASGGDSSVVPIVSAFGPYRRGGMPIVFAGGDSARMGNPRAPYWVKLDRDGHIVALSARATTTRAETRRVPNYDWHGLIAHFPNVSDSVGIAGVPAISPRDTVKTVFGDATITVDYGRPAVRGRTVFSRGVLGDTIWRTGANAATQFVTTRDLIIGPDTLRAGAYSLWTRISPDDSRYALVFNSQTGQWGTEHHSDRDVLSVPLRREDLRPSAERFTIRLPSAPRETQLRLEWSGTALVVPVRVR